MHSHDSLKHYDQMLAALRLQLAQGASDGKSLISLIKGSKCPYLIKQMNQILKQTRNTENEL